MGQITIDFEVVNQSCDHCHATFDLSRGSVYENGSRFSIYLAGMHKCHSGKLVHLVIAVSEGYKDFDETCAVACGSIQQKETLRCRLWMRKTHLG